MIVINRSELEWLNGLPKKKEHPTVVRQQRGKIYIMEHPAVLAALRHYRNLFVTEYK